MWSGKFDVGLETFGEHKMSYATKAQRSDLIYLPKYSDKYVQHLESLAQDTSSLNKDNVKLAKQALAGISIIEKKNLAITRRLIQQNEAPSVFGA